jgi:hypothetical protein
VYSKIIIYLLIIFTLGVSNLSQMEKEELSFSPLQLTYCFFYLLAAYYLFSSDHYLFIMIHNPIALLFAGGFTIYMLRSLRIGYFILTRRPAVVLTNESVVITDSGDEIKWIDVADVYLTHRGYKDVGSIQAYYVTIKLRDPEFYLKAIKSPFIRKCRWLTRKWKPSPVEIKLPLVRGDEDDNYRSVLRFYQNNRGF